MTQAQFYRLSNDQQEQVINFRLNQQDLTAQKGDTILTAILMHQSHVRMSEFKHQPRAGFCMMGACQDCWVSLDNGQRLRACSTLIEEGMSLQIEEPV